MSASYRDAGIRPQPARPSVAAVGTTLAEYLGNRAAAEQWPALLTQARLDGYEHDNGALKALFDAMISSKHPKIRLFGHAQRRKAFPPR